MIYLSGAVNKNLIPHVDRGEIGFLLTPKVRFYPKDSWVWAADNGCFNEDTYVGDDKWLKWLEKISEYPGTCLFATAPDVVGSHAKTLIRSRKWLKKIRKLGFKAAFVFQDGATIDTIPWGEFDVAFIGGTTEFKLIDSIPLVIESVRRGIPVHVGRVNSRKRFVMFSELGASSADGTFLAKNPSNYKMVLEFGSTSPRETSSIAVSHHLVKEKMHLSWMSTDERKQRVLDLIDNGMNIVDSALSTYKRNNNELVIASSGTNNNIVFSGIFKEKTHLFINHGKTNRELVSKLCDMWGCSLLDTISDEAVIIGGIRRDAYTERTAIHESHEHNGRLYINPFVLWTDMDIATYRKMFITPRNKTEDILGPGHDSQFAVETFFPHLLPPIAGELYSKNASF